MQEKKAQTDRLTLKVQEKNQKSVILWSNQDIQNNLNYLPTLYNVEIQKTYPKFQSKFKQINPKINQEIETDKKQYQLSELIKLHTQINSIQHEENLSITYQPLFKFFELLNNQIDTLIYINIEYNQLKVQYGQLNLPQIGIEQENVSKIKLLSEKMKDYINLQKQVLEKLNLDISLLQSQKNELHKTLNPLNDEILLLQKQLKNIENENGFLNEQSNKKFFQLSILQEQFNCFKRSSKQLCILVQKPKVYDQNYEPYYIIRNQKYIEINVRSDQQIVMPDNKKSQVFVQKNSNRFDEIIHRKQFLNEDLVQELLRHTYLFFIQVLCKSINSLYKSYPFNSNEIQAIFQTQRVPDDHYVKISQILNQEKKFVENQDSIVMFIVRKSSDFFLQFIIKVIKCIQSFENQFCGLQDLNIYYNILNIKEDSLKLILSSHLNDYEKKLNDIKLNASDSEIIQVKLELKLKHKLSRNIHFLYVIQERIENQEAFCKQFKDCYNKKKGIKDQIGSVLESIINNTDKFLIITEMPEMIKMTCNSEKKLNQLKNLVHFSQTMASKRQ